MKHMDIYEFRELGYLQEVNRIFFHPLGLALAIKNTDEGYVISGIQDFRDDPEGMEFTDLSKDSARYKAEYVYTQMKERLAIRKDRLGFGVQPIGNKKGTE